MIELKDYTKYWGQFVRVTLVNDQICDEGTTIEGFFGGYDFAVCSVKKKIMCQLIWGVAGCMA
ncbi:hypothetical protein [Helicobacter suis]|uniref:hypothetical protein n=1 Tax=Helicobacter suis TaxID=104628 RepID=UPI0024934BD4|nr:hypothetical protein [Helicobacter suis]